MHSLYARTLAGREVFFLPHMESTEAPPVADEARCFRGSAPVGGRVSAREPVGATVTSRKNDLTLFHREAVKLYEFFDNLKRVVFSGKRLFFRSGFYR